MLAATEAVAPALEIVDSRIRDWRITLVDTVADDASSAGLVCGPWTPLDEAPDLAAVTAGLLIDGRGVAAGTGKEVLGHPPPRSPGSPTRSPPSAPRWSRATWVLPGTMTGAPFVEAGRHVEARFGGLGAVSVTFV
ncbi:hypothetical protein [Streptomyces sp. NPDC048256]|uniref:hypothetical protein n=1 Tax=Streptomyces sp. NPDC048256 TaxID=3154613 RepID=UPI0033CEAF3B